MGTTITLTCGRYYSKDLARTPLRNVGTGGESAFSDRSFDFEEDEMKGIVVPMFSERAGTLRAWDPTHTPGLASSEAGNRHAIVTERGAVLQSAVLHCQHLVRQTDMLVRDIASIRDIACPDETRVQPDSSDTGIPGVWTLVSSGPATMSGTRSRSIVVRPPPHPSHSVPGPS